MDNAYLDLTFRLTKYSAQRIRFYAETDFRRLISIKNLIESDILC